MNPHTQSAIRILQAITDTHGPQAAAYWVGANTILTFSGVRAYCDGVFWSQEQAELDNWGKDIAACVETIKVATPVISAESSVKSVRDNELYAGYDLILRDGYEYILDNQTQLLGGATKDDLLRSELTGGAVLTKVEKILTAREEFKNYDQEDIKGIGFGVLVGYPDEAIRQAMAFWSQPDDPFREKLINANILGVDYYFCPQPDYMYPRSLASDPVITTHERLWSTILTEYYRSDFHRSLESDKAFMDKLAELGLLRS